MAMNKVVHAAQRAAFSVTIDDTINAPTVRAATETVTAIIIVKIKLTTPTGTPANRALLSSNEI